MIIFFSENLLLLSSMVSVIGSRSIELFMPDIEIIYEGIAQLMIQQQRAV